MFGASGGWKTSSERAQSKVFMSLSFAEFLERGVDDGYPTIMRTLGLRFLPALLLVAMGAAAHAD